MFTQRFARLLGVGAVALAMVGCASHYDRKTNNALMGAGLGAAAGAVVSQGDPVYAIGGAAAGGLLGHILTSDDRRSRGWDRAVVLIRPSIAATVTTGDTPATIGIAADTAPLR